MSMARARIVLLGLAAALFAVPRGAAASGSHHSHQNQPSTKSSHHHHHRTPKTTTPTDRSAPPDDNATPPDSDAPPPPSTEAPPPSRATSPESAASSPSNALESSEETPWSKGVPAAERNAAQTLVSEGNRLVEDSLFIQALEKYRAALKHWDHPAIHFNMALALINLDRPIDVSQELEQAMQYGDAPLGADKFENAKSYKSLVEGQLARVVIECEVSGAQVAMDGKLLFVAPGRHETLVRAGGHTVVASREGYVPTQRTETLPAGKKTLLKLTLYTNDELTRYRRKFPVWKPWMAVVAGVVVGGAGGILHWQAGRDFAAYDRGIADCSQRNNGQGCISVPPDVAALQTRAQALRTAAFAAYGVGGAGVVTGIVLVGVNRRVAYRIKPADDQPPVSLSLHLAPVLGPGQAGMVATLRF
ncbi:MAG TPA: hypothetical protein VH877_27585 [Polyangia bacterium]|nr:hypothetical protein [Polyangia bacterium]